MSEHKPEFGDKVKAVTPFVLDCGSGRYSHAFVVQEEPLILISECGDMMWRATLEGDVETVGTGSPVEMIAPTRRFIQELRNETGELKVDISILQNELSKIDEILHPTNG